MNQEGCLSQVLREALNGQAGAYAHLDTWERTRPIDYTRDLIRLYEADGDSTQDDLHYVILSLLKAVWRRSELQADFREVLRRPLQKLVLDHISPVLHLGNYWGSAASNIRQNPAEFDQLLELLYSLARKSFPDEWPELIGVFQKLIRDRLVAAVNGVQQSTEVDFAQLVLLCRCIEADLSLRVPRIRAQREAIWDQIDVVPNLISLGLLIQHQPSQVVISHMLVSLKLFCRREPQAFSCNAYRTGLDATRSEATVRSVVANSKRYLVENTRWDGLSEEDIAMRALLLQDGIASWVSGERDLTLTDEEMQTRMLALMEHSINSLAVIKSTSNELNHLDTLLTLEMDFLQEYLDYLWRQGKRSTPNALPLEQTCVRALITLAYALEMHRGIDAPQSVLRSPGLHLSSLVELNELEETSFRLHAERLCTALIRVSECDYLFDPALPFMQQQWTDLWSPLLLLCYAQAAEAIKRPISPQLLARLREKDSRMARILDNECELLRACLCTNVDGGNPGESLVALEALSLLIRIEDELHQQTRVGAAIFNLVQRLGETSDNPGYWCRKIPGLVNLCSSLSLTPHLITSALKMLQARYAGSMDDDEVLDDLDKGFVAVEMLLDRLWDENHINAAIEVWLQIRDESLTMLRLVRGMWADKRRLVKHPAAACSCLKVCLMLSWSRLAALCAYGTPAASEVISELLATVHTLVHRESELVASDGTGRKGFTGAFVLMSEALHLELLCSGGGEARTTLQVIADSGLASKPLDISFGSFTGVIDPIIGNILTLAGELGTLRLQGWNVPDLTPINRVCGGIANALERIHPPSTCRKTHFGLLRANRVLAFDINPEVVKDWAPGAAFLAILGKLTPEVATICGYRDYGDVFNSRIPLSVILASRTGLNGSFDEMLIAKVGERVRHIEEGLETQSGLWGNILRKFRFTELGYCWGNTIFPAWAQIEAEIRLVGPNIESVTEELRRIVPP